MTPDSPRTLPVEPACPSIPDALPLSAVRVLDRLCEPSAPPKFTAVDVLDLLDEAATLTVAEVLDALLDHELVSSAGDVGGRPVYVVHPEDRPF
ncbi:hypothetical protein [Rubrivirga litoralis]|uniref:DprA winged helix domain-containing protein n=1 Tax=Rubrivirga litoralis TaxID=3075598 RepID=A0ABU3BUI0_9BACT|nr:hypothetical protein [Rubrivirga sp. F394]MDT0632932.1 hypothetical protein [Rubrivirga sp. F394]